MRRSPSSCCPASRTMSAVLTVVLAASVAAQVGGHRHIAPLAPGVSLSGRGSPLMNAPDAYWDRGEAFWNPEVPDIGGVLGPDNYPQFVLWCGTAGCYVKDQRAGTPTPGWQPVAGTSRQDFIGELRGYPDGEGTTVAAFKLLAPAVMGSTPLRDKVVVVISLQATFGHPQVYPGFGLTNGLTAGSYPYASALVDHFLAQAGYWVMAGHIVPRTGYRPLVFTVQRARQLRRVILDMLTNPMSPNKIGGTLFDGNKVAFVAGGSSFGGLPAQALVLLWPNEFHAGIGVAYGTNQRGVPNCEDADDFTAAALGYGGSGAGYDAHDAFDWAMFCSLEQTDYMSLSLVNRLRRGELYRPWHQLVADEDPVAQGVDWIPMLDPSGTASYRDGTITVQNNQSHPVSLTWSSIGKICHETATYGDPYYPNPSGTTTSHDEMDAAYEIVKKAAPEVGSPPLTITPPPRTVPMYTGGGAQYPTGFTTLDPWDVMFNRRYGGALPAGTQQGLLLEAPSFRRGQGTWLGVDESLKIADPGNGKPISVFVGSQDGVVTRFELQTKTQSGGPTVKALVQAASSNLNGTNLYALGYGVHGLAVGDVDPTIAGNEVVAAAYRRIGLFKPTFRRIG